MQVYILKILEFKENWKYKLLFLSHDPPEDLTNRFTS